MDGTITKQQRTTERRDKFITWRWKQKGLSEENEGEKICSFFQKRTSSQPYKTQMKR